MKSWIEALRKFNQGKTEWCVPKKDTAEYQKVKSMMKGAPPAKKKVVVDSAKPLGGVVKKVEKDTKIQKAIAREDLGIHNKKFAPHGVDASNVLEGKRVR